MTRAVAAALILAVPLPALGGSPPGRAVEVGPCVEGKACPGDDGMVLRLPGAPYQGTLADRDRMLAIWQRRDAAERERDLLSLQKKDLEAKLSACRGSQGASWGVVVGVSGAAALAGLIVGLVLGAR